MTSQKKYYTFISTTQASSPARLIRMDCRGITQAPIPKINLFSPIAHPSTSTATKGTDHKSLNKQFESIISVQAAKGSVPSLTNKTSDMQLKNSSSNENKSLLTVMQSFIKSRFTGCTMVGHKLNQRNIKYVPHVPQTVIPILIVPSVPKKAIPLANIVAEPVDKCETQTVEPVVETQTVEPIVNDSVISLPACTGSEGTFNSVVGIPSSQALTCQVDTPIAVDTSSTDISPTFSVVTPSEMDTACDTDIADVMVDSLPGVSDLEIDHKMDSQCRALRDLCEGIPEVGAAETVVVTSTPPGTQKGTEETYCIIEPTPSPKRQQGNAMAVGRCSICNSVVDVNTASIAVTCKGACLINKRERERLKKQEIRKDPNFRAKEREYTRIRMRNRRADPKYRDQERNKDRERRWVARQTKPELRLRERQRDKEHKRNLRVHRLAAATLPGCMSPHTVAQEVEIDMTEPGESVYGALDIAGSQSSDCGDT